MIRCYAVFAAIAFEKPRLLGFDLFYFSKAIKENAKNPAGPQVPSSLLALMYMPLKTRCYLHLPQQCGSDWKDSNTKWAQAADAGE